MDTKFSRAALAAVILIGLIAVPQGATAASHAPLGYQVMCLKTPSACEGGGASTIKTTASVMDTLKRVNRSVNAKIKPRNDSAGDVWTVNAKSGDCEDFALAKRQALIKAGLPPSALRLAYVKTRSGVGHAILLVKTKTGTFVLDNLYSAVKPLSQTGYRVVSSATANPKIWS